MSDEITTPSQDEQHFCAETLDESENADNPVETQEELPATSDACDSSEETAQETNQTKSKKIVIKKENVIEYSKYLILLLILASLRAFTNYVFIIPNAFAPGGLSGISSIIYNAIEPVNHELAHTVFEPGLTTFVMNIPFIIASFFLINKKFAVNTFLVVLVYSAAMKIFDVTGAPQFAVPDDSGFRILAALSGGALTGVILGYMLRNNMSMGGTDIVGKIIHKKRPQTGAHIWILVCDCAVAVASCVIGILRIVRGEIQISDDSTISAVSQGFVAVVSPILYSFISLFTGSMTADVVQSGYQSSIVFTIITDKPDDISQAISEKLHRGVTLSTAMGYYTKAEHYVLTVVVSKRQIVNVKKIIQAADPLAFTYVTKASEVAGKGFHSAG